MPRILFRAKDIFVLELNTTKEECLLVPYKIIIMISVVVRIKKMILCK